MIEFRFRGEAQLSDVGRSAGILPLPGASIARQKSSACAWLSGWRRPATGSVVAFLAGKLSFPAIDPKLRGRAAESRVAEGDERSELALDAADRPRNRPSQFQGDSQLPLRLP